MFFAQITSILEGIHKNWEIGNMGVLWVTRQGLGGSGENQIGTIFLSTRGGLQAEKKSFFPGKISDTEIWKEDSKKSFFSQGQVFLLNCWFITLAE